MFYHPFSLMMRMGQMWYERTESHTHTHTFAGESTSINWTCCTPLNWYRVMAAVARLLFEHLFSSDETVACGRKLSASCLKMLFLVSAPAPVLVHYCNEYESSQFEPISLSITSFPTSFKKCVCARAAWFVFFFLIFSATSLQICNLKLALQSTNLWFRKGFTAAAAGASFLYFLFHASL